MPRLLLLVALVSCLQAPTPVRVVMQTEAGNIEIEVDSVHAPVTAANFLKYVDAAMYDGGQFHRTVRPDNQTEKPIRIAVIQGAASADRKGEFFPPISLERTSVTGLRHTDGSPTRPRISSSSASGISPSWISAARAIPTVRDLPRSAGS